MAGTDVTAEQAIIGAVFAGLALLVQHFGKHAVSAFRAWLRHRRALHEVEARERARMVQGVREDTGRFVAVIADASDQSIEILREWFREVKAENADLKERVKRLEADAVQRDDALRALRRELRDEKLERERLERIVEVQREKMLKDYVQKSIPAPPPEEPHHTLREVKRNER